MRCHNCGSDLVYTIGGYLVCDNCEIVYGDLGVINNKFKQQLEGLE